MPAAGLASPGPPLPHARVAQGLHRIRHYGLLANGGTTRAETLARVRQLIAAAPQIAPSPQPPHDDGTCEDATPSEEFDHPCPHCGSRMVIIETFGAAGGPRHRLLVSARFILLNQFVQPARATPAASG